MFSDEDIIFHKKALKQLDYLSKRNKRSEKKIDDIIEDIKQFGYGGHFHPEMLRGNRSGWCSKEVDKKNRLVFTIKENKVFIAQVMGHYEDH
jgi:toxin YoeB